MRRAEMSDPREMTRIDTEEVELASNEYLYCFGRSGMPEGGRQVIIATEVFRSKDGKTWEKWMEAEG